LIFSKFLLFVPAEFTYENVLSGAQLQLVANASGCLNHRVEPDCSNMCFHKKYRTIDGTCNNLQKPLLGSSLAAFKRLLPPAYENGFNLPVGNKPFSIQMPFAVVAFLTRWRRTTSCRLLPLDDSKYRSRSHRLR